MARLSFHATTRRRGKLSRMAGPLPVLVAVDQDALEDVTAQLTQRYGRDYRVEGFGDPTEALRALTELDEDGGEVALVLVGESSAAAGDGKLFEHIRRLHPHAKRALLVSANAWTDDPTADAIRASMALGRIDHYVFRPASSPDEVFHEAVSDFLLEWAREQHLVPQTVHIVGEDWSGRAFELREVFRRCAVPHDFCLADSEKGRTLMATAGPDAELPVMILPDGRVLSDPSDAEIAEAAGAPMDLDEKTYEVVIVGAGPAGLSAAVYAASEGLRVLVVDSGGIGGQAASSSLIRNYLGFGKGVSGSRLAEEAYEQAMAFGATFLFLHRVTALDRSAGWFHLPTLRRPVRQRPRRDPRNRSDLPPSRHRVARGARRRGRVLRRPGLGSSRADRQGGLRRRRRELRRPGGAALRPLRKPRDDGRTRRVAGGRHVALSDPGDRGRAERRREDGDHHRRRRGRGPPPAPRAARSRRRRGDHGRRGRPLHPDRSPTARPTGYPPKCSATSTASC